MIAKKFYSNNKNTSKIFLGGKRSHFNHRERVTVVKSYPYTIKGGEDIYSIAARVFGDSDQSFWYIIADSNNLRPITEWESGDVIYLPEIIVLENEKTQRRELLELAKLNTVKYA